MDRNNYLKLRSERQKRNWTLTFVSSRLGIKPQSLLQLEAGLHNPSYETLLKIENLFEMNHRDLFIRDDGKPTKK